MTEKSRFFNDGSGDLPKLRAYLNLDTLMDQHEFGPQKGSEFVSPFERLAADGFEGVQLTENIPLKADLGLPFCGLDRINTPDEADFIAARHTDRGDHCITLHVGWGLEDDFEVYRLVEAILTASVKHRLPMFVESHRTTITQDL
jgi:hypothetical protein